MDPSSSISSQAMQAETVTQLKYEWHKAAIDGDAEPFDNFQGSLDCLVTPSQNTVLHVHLAIPNYNYRIIGPVPTCYMPLRYQDTNLRCSEFVQQILKKCPPLLWKPNAKGEIPLHIAAMFGHSNIVVLLINTAKAEQKDLENGIDPSKQMVRMTDKEGDTALHKAIRYGHANVVRELLLADPDFSYSVNHSGETPLYIAARRGYDKLVAMILDSSESADHGGPCGRTALHATVMADNELTTNEILSKRKNLVKARDENGQTALHYAAHLGHTTIVKLLLKCDESAAYVIDKDKMTALHMAARQGHLGVVKEIINYCPDCCEIVDKRGWNFYHFAVVSLSVTTLSKFLGNNSYRRFLGEKDIHGNTPLQVLAASRQYNYGIPRAFSDDIVTVVMENFDSRKKEKILELLEEVGNGEVAGVSVYPLRTFNQVADLEKLDKSREARAIEAALIATVAFAAGFTVPGGYKSDQSDQDRGSAILIHDVAFQAFVITDAIAMISALLTVKFSYVCDYLIGTQGRRRYSVNSYNLMLMFGHLAETALVLAFITGVYAVLKPTLALAITNCVIVLCFFICFFCLIEVLELGYFRSFILFIFDRFNVCNSKGVEL